MLIFKMLWGKFKSILDELSLIEIGGLGVVAVGLILTGYTFMYL